MKTKLKCQVFYQLWPALLCWLSLLLAPHAAAYYDPGMQRWINRDPIGEPGFELIRRQTYQLTEGGHNGHAFLFNSPLNNLDPFGLIVRPPGFPPEVLEDCRQQARGVLIDCLKDVNCFFAPIGDWLNMFESSLDGACATSSGILAKLACLAAKAATRVAKGMGGAAKLGALSGCAAAASNAYHGCLAEHTPPGDTYPIYPTPP